MTAITLDRTTQSRLNSTSRLAGIFGASRSGTTWLGSIVSSHPEVVYRFEPFHRLQKKNPEIREISELFRSKTFSDLHLSKVYQALLPSYPELEKPPFFAQCPNIGLSLGKSLLWAIARKNGVASHLFRHLYTPKNAPMLVFKEVEMVSALQCLLATEIPIVYIMRHPCAVVWSRIRGQQNYLMPSGRVQMLPSLLANHSPMLAHRYAGKLEGLTFAEKEALLWRIDLEKALSVCQHNPNGLSIVYEELAQYPFKVAQKVFSHLGLPMSRESISFIEESSSGQQNQRLKWGEIGINSYFTVFRNSQASCHAWKEKMPRADRLRVMRVVEDSKPFKLAASQGFWD